MPSRRPADVCGLLLAAGEGRRMGRPKALVGTDGTSWGARATEVLLRGGCAEVLVVVGAEAAAVRAALPLADDRVSAVECVDWRRGMGESLRAGLTALGVRDGGVPEVALVHLVDLPDVGPGVVSRLLAAAGGTATLARAAYGGVPGHPVLLGRDHWAGVADSAAGDRGARAYLAARGPRLVECGDLARGLDVDTPG